MEEDVYCIVFLSTAVKMTRYSVEPENATKCKIAFVVHCLGPYVGLIVFVFASQHARRVAPTSGFTLRLVFIGLLSVATWSCCDGVFTGL